MLWRLVSIVGAALLFATATAITQVGGVVFLLALSIGWSLRRYGLGKHKVRWLTFRWDMDWFQPFVRHDLALDEERTGAMLRWLTERGPAHGIEKILLEPHMAGRLGATSPLIRFQGCRAARHDDHVHVEVVGQPIANR